MDLLDDVQTGHHSMNLALPIIKRIEIIKGPASRVFGQNAFTGAVNIVTKDSLDNDASLRLQAGSYGQFSAAVTAELV
jgi:iron complex outermembrane receptor protein